MPSTTAALKQPNQPIKPAQNEEIKVPTPSPIVEAAKETAKSFISEIVTKVEEKAKEVAEVAKSEVQKEVTAIKEKLKAVTEVEKEVAPLVSKVEDTKEKLKAAAKADVTKAEELTAREEVQARVEAEKRRRWLLGYGRG